MSEMSGMSNKVSNNKVAMAVAAHPDDIEFMMAGTLILLGQQGYELHYMTIATGSCGTSTLSRDEIVKIRTGEARAAAESIGAGYHAPLVDDLEIFYTQPLIRKLGAMVRAVKPQILLLPSPQDYMEDHMTSSRLMVTAAFARNMKNYITDPPVDFIEGDMCIYHALPMGLQDQLRRPVLPDFCVDVTGVMPQKRDMLLCHQSQKQWLDESQGHDNYLHLMEDMMKAVGKVSGRFQYAEGWRRHLHLGFGPPDFDPLGGALSEYITPTHGGQ